MKRSELGARDERVHVELSPAMLRMLWQAQLSRGVMSIERRGAVARDARLELVLVVTGQEIALAATVRSCVPHGESFSVHVTLDEVVEPQRTTIRQIAGLHGQ